jgi:hypothetical protein
VPVACPRSLSRRGYGSESLVSERRRRHWQSHCHCQWQCLRLQCQLEVAIRTRARRFLRCIPSQVCFEPLTRTRMEPEPASESLAGTIVLQLEVQSTLGLEYSAGSAEPWCGWSQGRRNGGTYQWCQSASPLEAFKLAPCQCGIIAGMLQLSRHWQPLALNLNLNCNVPVVMLA